MTPKLRSFMGDRSSRAVASRLALLVVMIGISFYFSTDNARSPIYDIYFYPSTPGVGCLTWGINTFEECSVVAFCTELDATDEFLSAGVWTGVTCPGGRWVLNQARMTGAVGTMGVAGYAKSTTIPGFRNMGEA